MPSADLGAAQLSLQKQHPQRGGGGPGRMKKWGGGCKAKWRIFWHRNDHVTVKRGASHRPHGSLLGSNTQVDPRFLSRGGALSRPVASCPLDSRVQGGGGPAGDGRAAFQPEIQHVIELFGVGNRSVTCSWFMLQHPVSRRSLADLSSPLFIFPPSLSNRLFSELHVGRGCESIAGVNMSSLGGKRRPVFLQERQGWQPFQPPNPFSVAPPGSGDVNKSLFGLRLGERQIGSVSPLFSPQWNPSILFEFYYKGWKHRTQNRLVFSRDIPMRLLSRRSSTHIIFSSFPLPPLSAGCVCVWGVAYRCVFMGAGG